MKYKNRLKRVADTLEKLGVAGIAVGVFQGNMTGFWAAVIFLIVSISLTKED
ncbi:hypothetical protein [Desulfovibrio sp. ZJ200]|uniref:hypothetical protein n=1 Tax=Desulfovibrio sp. ZJ200 TaxID=2709792 RepID=UPI0013EE331A|nr:hypothetical protein [Desulfovibrio sp. ZJ200]